MFYKIIIIIIVILNKNICTNNSNNKKTNNKIKTIETNKMIYNTDIINKITITKNEKPKHKLIIDKINLNRNIYDYKSKHNNIEENIAIIKDTKDIKDKNSLIVIAAHSGTGKLAYFNDLNKLKINDTITLIYNNNSYTFTIKKIWEQDKIGYININKEDNSELILTTCSIKNKNKQLIIQSILKES